MQLEPTERGQRKTRKGVVVSNKMLNTVIVKVERKLRHPQYGKVIIRAKKYYAHNTWGALQEGDVVEIMETKPISKLKRWRVVDRVQTAAEPAAQMA